MSGKALGGWLVTNPNINFAHYFSGPELSDALKAILGPKHVSSRCGTTFEPKSVGRPAAWGGDPVREPSKICGRCLRSALALVPDAMRRDLKAQEGRFAAEMIERYLRSDEAGRADMLAFHESHGPEKLRQAKVKHEDGTPTAADLEKGLGL